MATTQPLIPSYYDPAFDPERIPEIAAARSRVADGLGQVAFDGAIHGIGAAGDGVGDVALGIVGAFTGEVPPVPHATYEPMASAPVATPDMVAGLPPLDAQQLQALTARQMPPSPQAAWLN